MFSKRTRCTDFGQTLFGLNASTFNVVNGQLVAEAASSGGWLEPVKGQRDTVIAYCGSTVDRRTGESVFTAKLRGELNQSNPIRT